MVRGEPGIGRLEVRSLFGNAPQGALANPRSPGAWPGFAFDQLLAGEALFLVVALGPFFENHNSIRNRPA
jgi:hypothetical protein